MKLRNPSLFFFLVILIVVLHNTIPHHHHEGMVVMHHHHGDADQPEESPADDHETESCILWDLDLSIPRIENLIKQDDGHGSPSFAGIHSVLFKLADPFPGSGVFHPPPESELHPETFTCIFLRGPPRPIRFI